MTQRLMCSSGLLLLAAATIACGLSSTPGVDDVGAEPGSVDPKVGGQSGGEGSSSCERKARPLATAMSDGTRAVDLLDGFEAALAARPRLQWWPKIRERMRIELTSLELTELTHADAALVGCNMIELPIDLDVRSEDGVLDARFSGNLVALTGATDLITVTAQLVDGGLGAGPARAGLEADGPLQIELRWREEAPDELSGSMDALDASEPIAYIGRDAVRYWEPTIVEQPQALMSSDLQRNVCAKQSPTSLATFASEQALRESLAKRWVVCSGTARVDPRFAGFEIHADGRWHELRVEDGELVAVQGFGHEGHVARNVFGDDFNLAILDWLPGGYEFAYAGLSSDGNSLSIQAQPVDSELDATFQATDLPVRYPPLPYEPGARAGLAACAAPEADVVSRPASESELRAQLAGRWSFCRGALGTHYAGIEFSANAAEYALLDAGGARVERGKLQIIDTSDQNGPGVFQLNIKAAKRTVVLHPVIASTPLKMLARDEFDSLLVAVPD
ncbi:MAG TPA: hypothetical protein VJR89_39985 [Polyangiales bacterium]|nr:hypothetical protein [Polyangiales bacterium]